MHISMHVVLINTAFEIQEIPSSPVRIILVEQQNNVKHDVFINLEEHIVFGAMLL